LQPPFVLSILLSINITEWYQNQGHYWPQFQLRRFLMLITLFPKASRKYLSLPVFGPVMDDFSDWLEQEGYTRKSRRYAIRMIAWMDAYLRRRRIKRLQELTPLALHGCWKALQRRLPTAAGTVHVMERFLTERGLLKPFPRQVSSPTEIQLQKYAEHLRDVRGFSCSTVHHHLYTTACFLNHLGFDNRPSRLAGIDASDLEDFLRKISHGLTRGTIQHTVAELRGFLRFLAANGQVKPGLESQIDTPRLYRQEQLPRALPWETVRAFLQSIPRNNPLGRRDHAMFFLMATYGLRSCEIVALTLDDLQWRAGLIRIPQPKTGKALELPLTDEAANVLIEYLRKVPCPTGYRNLFLRMRAPIGILKPTGVSGAFKSWSRRSGLGIPFQGPHCIRHSYAVHLLRQGTSLKAIGDLLGHRYADSTASYLRLATEDLREVGLSVPLPLSNTEVRS
jgi:integrase/recombinase XerD